MRWPSLTCLQLLQLEAQAALSFATHTESETLERSCDHVVESRLQHWTPCVGHGNEVLQGTETSGSDGGA